MTKKRFWILNVLTKNSGIKDGDKLLSFDEVVDLLNNLSDENKQLKQDNTGLMHLLENQSIIIQELHSKLLEHHIKEPIVLTKEDLKLMDKAISYYTHGRYGE